MASPSIRPSALKGRREATICRAPLQRPSWGRHVSYPREVVNRKPDVIVAATAITQAVNAAASTIPIVWVGADPIRAGLVTSLARPGGNITGVSVDAGIEIWGKRLQILKEAVPSASKVAVLATPTAWESGDGKGLREASQRLEIPLIAVLLRESAPSEYQRVFADIVQQRPDAIIVSAAGELSPAIIFGSTGQPAG